jgi:pyruvate dehydrogenase E1 component alpha subunit
MGHHVGDVDRSYYRTREEEQEWRSKRDPIELAAGWILEDGHADEATLTEIEARVVAEVAVAVEAAIAAPFPDPDEVDEHVFA